MTDGEQDALRRALSRVIARTGAVGWSLIHAIHTAKDLEALRASPELQNANNVLGDLAKWIRQSAGPEDLAKIDAPRATDNPQPTTRNQQ